MPDSNERLSSSIVQLWGKLRNIGKPIFSVLFVIASAGIACDLIVIISLLNWHVLSHMSDKQLSMVIGIDLAVLVLFSVLGWFGAQLMWRSMDRFCQRLSPKGKEQEALSRKTTAGR